MMKRITNTIGRLPVGLALAAAIAVAGCEVTNPGQVLDEDLNREDALRVVVNGMGGDMTVAHRHYGWNMNVFTGDMSGTSAYKSRVQHWQGRPDEEDAEDYNSLYAVVSIADRGLERINTVLGEEVSSSSLAAEAYMWAGWANRYAGDAFCQAVIDGGAPQPRTVYHERAVDYFSQAIDIASSAGTEETLLASYGGRAHSRMQLGDWEGALADAAMVPEDFAFTIKMDAASGREWNEVFYENQQRTNLNTKWTWFERYNDEYPDDPRVGFYTREGVTAADGSGLQLMHTKYTSFNDDIEAVSGPQMRLLEAEYEITQGDWQTGLDMVNAVRADANPDLEPWTASNQAEAFEALKKERAIETWLESRRGGDLWRWGNTAAGDPIIAAMYELTPSPENYPGGAGGLVVPQDQRAICFPFSITMKNTNENID